jgi:UDP-glucuronate 4-epimerase
MLKRALVTGCAGFIGSHLTEALLTQGVHVVGVDCFNDNYVRRSKLGNLSHRAKDWDNFDFVPIDLSGGDLGEFVEGCDVVFHLAAEPGVRSSWTGRFERYVQNNVVATQHVLDALLGSPETRLVYASSSSIYGNAESFPTPETAIPRPVSPYGVTKLGGEHLCQAYSATHGLHTVSLRYFTVYGPRQRPDMAFNRFIRAALDRERITVFGDGHQTRDFTYIDDIVVTTIQAAVAEVPAGSVYNLGGGSQTSVRDVLGIMSRLTGIVLDVEYAGEADGDVRDTSADTSHARAALAFEPHTSLQDGLAAQLEWQKQAAVVPA